jgi:transposase
VGARALARRKKNARRRHAWIVLQDESGVSQRPSVRRTWAPRGQTPVWVHAFNWQKMSLCAALAYRWAGCRARLFFQMRPNSYDSAALVGFLQDLRKELRGQRVILIWDGLPAHQSRLVQAYLRTQQRWLHVERLPGYAPELNPTESLWENLKGQELANYCGESLHAAATQCRKGVRRVRQHTSLLFSFLKHAGLTL